MRTVSHPADSPPFAEQRPWRRPGSPQPLQTRHPGPLSPDGCLVGWSRCYPAHRPSRCALPRGEMPAPNRAARPRRLPAEPPPPWPPGEQYRAAARTPCQRGCQDRRRPRPPGPVATPPRRRRAQAPCRRKLPRASLGRQRIATSVDQAASRSSRLLVRARWRGPWPVAASPRCRGFRRAASAIRPTCIGHRAPAHGEIAEQSPGHEVMRLAPRRLEQGRPRAADSRRAEHRPPPWRSRCRAPRRRARASRRPSRSRARVPPGSGPCASERYFSARADRPTSAAPNTITTAQANHDRPAHGCRALRGRPPPRAHEDGRARQREPGHARNQVQPVDGRVHQPHEKRATGGDRQATVLELECARLALGARTRTARPQEQRERGAPDHARARRALGARCCEAGGCPPWCGAPGSRCGRSCRLPRRAAARRGTGSRPRASSRSGCPRRS